MDSIISTLFSPINSKDYCNFYYYLEVMYFVFFIGSLITMGVGAYHKKMNTNYYIIGVSGLILKLLMYAQCRLLYSMCVK